MAMQTTWLVENRVIVSVLTGKPSLEELQTQDAQIVRMMQSAPDKTVHLMLDCSTADSLPPFSGLRSLQSRHQPNKGWVIIFGNISPLIRAVAEVAARILGDKMHMFRYRRDAMRFLQTIESDLALPAETGQV